MSFPICGFQGTCTIGFPMSGDEGIRTLDPLLARQVLSQLSYTPMGFSMYVSVSSSSNSRLMPGLKWTRTTDLTLIRRAL